MTMTTTIKVQEPPCGIFERAKEMFDLRGKRPVFAWEGVIYNPMAGVLDEHIIRHEETHFGQQAKMGGAEAWFEKWFEDDDFRFRQELEAYRAQWKSIQGGVKDRNDALQQLVRIARDLASGMYGDVMPVPLAMRLIKGEVEPA